MLKFFLFAYNLTGRLNKTSPPIALTLGKISHILYRLLCMFLGIDFHWSIKTGKNFRISHFVGIVVNENTIFGDNCWIRQNTT